MIHSALRRSRVVWLVPDLVRSSLTAAYAVHSSASLSGTVIKGGAPAPRVPVTATGNNVVLSTTADANGRFMSASLDFGSYELEALTHDQSYGVAGGLLLNDRHSGCFSADAECGSGRSSGACPADTPGNCKRTPHTVFAGEEGVGFAPQVALALGIQNLPNDRYFVTLRNAQANHYAPPRTLNVGVSVGR